MTSRVISARGRETISIAEWVRNHPSFLAKAAIIGAFGVWMGYQVLWTTRQFAALGDLLVR
jgi:hypothetical protein